MIFYECADEQGRRKLAGTQADARAISPNFKQIDVPVDKSGLMKFIQDLLDQIHAVSLHAKTPDQVSDNRIPVVDPDSTPAGDVDHQSLSYTETSVWTDETFFNLPLAHRLTLASLTLEDVRNRIPSLKS